MYSISRKFERMRTNETLVKTEISFFILQSSVIYYNIHFFYYSSRF